MECFLDNNAVFLITTHQDNRMCDEKCRKTRLDQDFIENGSNDFANMGNLKEPDDTLSVQGAAMF